MTSLKWKYIFLACADSSWNLYLPNFTKISEYVFIETLLCVYDADMNALLYYNEQVCSIKWTIKKTFVDYKTFPSSYMHNIHMFQFLLISFINISVSFSTHITFSWILCKVLVSITTRPCSTNLYGCWTHRKRMLCNFLHVAMVYSETKYSR